MTTRSLRIAMVLIATSGLAAAGRCQDADGDGLPDAIEERLGTDPQTSEELVVLGEFPAGSEDHPELDLVRVEFGNVAENRWLWAIHSAEAYTFENSSIIIYLDADNEAATGRTGMGCEVMLSHSKGAPGVTGFAPDGEGILALPPRVALHEGVLYISHDGEISQVEGKSAFRFTILSETRVPHASVDSTGWLAATGPPNSDRRPIMLLDDIAANENVETTEGLDLIWELQADPANVVFQTPDAELDGFAYYDTEYRWPAVRGAGGTITVTVPEAGTYHPAVVVYDTGGRDAYELLLDDERIGRFLAIEDDNRQRVHFLSEPVTFEGGETLTIRAGSGGSHITEDILLLAEPPPIRGRKYELSEVEAGLVRRGGTAQVRLTWITTWPTACAVEYWAGEGDRRTVTEETPLANHRLYLTDVEEGQEYSYRIVAPKPDGEDVTSEELSFTCAPPTAPAGTATREQLPLTVENPYAFDIAQSPITSGVPFAEGELGDAEHVRLLDSEGQEVAVQPVVAARWRSGSIKWLRCSFLASVPASAAAEYVLEYGTEVSPAPVPTPLTSEADGDAITVDTGAVTAVFDAGLSGFPTEIRLGDTAVPLSASITSGDGTVHTSGGAADLIEIEEAGPVRVIVKTTGHHVNADGEPFMAYTNRFVFYAGLPMVRVYYTWGNDVAESEFTDFNAISLNVPLTGSSWTVGLGEGEEASGQDELALSQLRDDAFTLTSGENGSRADGWIDVSDGEWGLTTAVRDFWQLYPKGFRVTSDGLAVDLCPDFPEGTYDDCSKLDEIKLYFYLMGGKYKIRRGMQKQHEIMLYLHEGDLEDASRQAAAVFQEPLIATCEPERYCGTGVFGDVLPATTGRWPEYEEVCENVLTNYVKHQQNTRGYGMLNFGDQFGERKVNWANGEYDHHHAFLMQFARTADRRWYFLGEKAGRHAIDVDTCHHGPKSGGVWVHAMGHVGNYFTEGYDGGGIPGGGFTVSHTWTEGFYDWYVLSGDPTGAENAALVADHFDGAYLNSYDWGNCRTNGWHLLLTMAAYRATNDPYYLNAARIIIERTLERQTPGGGWHRQMVPGHCLDMPRHRGVANFMLGVLANGLEEYYREIPDARVAEAVVGGARQTVAELWVPESDGFRYTSCPNMTGYTANNDMTAEVLFFAYRVGGDREHGEIAMRAMRKAFEGGIGSIAHLRWTHHILYNMDLLAREGM